MLSTIPTAPCTMLNGIPAAEAAIPAASAAWLKAPLVTAASPASYAKYPVTMTASPMSPPAMTAPMRPVVVLFLRFTKRNKSPAIPAVSALMMRVAGAKEA